MPTPVVFVPGLTCTGRIYAHQAERLGRNRTVTLAEPWRASSMAEIAEQVLAGAPERFCLVGLSMGGYVAFEIMRQAPERVEKLALLSTTARPDTPERTALRRQQVAAARMLGARRGFMAAFPTLVHPARHEDAALRTVLLDMAEELGLDVFERQTEAIIGRADSRPLLPAIAVPTLVVAGAEDALVPAALAQEIAAQIPGARLETIMHCGHMVSLEMPETLMKLLEEFFG
jgi:pimeloyl-ACP methyl ester carboxylesterase